MSKKEQRKIYQDGIMLLSTASNFFLKSTISLWSFPRKTFEPLLDSGHQKLQKAKLWVGTCVHVLVARD